MSSRPSACADTARAECRFDGCGCSLECTQESQATARLPKVSGADAPDWPCIVSVQAAAHLRPVLASPAKTADGTQPERGTAGGCPARRSGRLLHHEPAHAAQWALWAESGAPPLIPAAAAWAESVVTCLFRGRPNLFRGLHPRRVLES